MSVMEMERLATDFTTNSALRGRIEQTSTLEDAQSVAKKAGYDVTVEEARSYLTKIQTASQAELSDTQLDAVAGGKNSKVGTDIEKGLSAAGNWLNSHPGIVTGVLNAIPKVIPE